MKFTPRILYTTGKDVIGEVAANSTANRILPMPQLP